MTGPLIVALAQLAVILFAAGAFYQRMLQMEIIVKKIAENDIPHIEGEIRNIRNDLTNLNLARTFHSREVRSGENTSHSGSA